MKDLKENMKIISAYAGSDTVNAENFPAWRPSDATLLEQLAMTGTLGNSFYANAKETTAEAVRLLDRVGASELAAAIVRGRNEGFIRTFPILGLAYLSLKDAKLFRDTFDQVVLTGNDLVDFIDLTRTVRGFGRSVKAAIGAWIRKNATPYYAQKYRRQMADAIRLSRFKGEDSIYAYILSAYSNVKGASAEKLQKAYADHPELAAHRDFVAAIAANDLSAAEQILRENNLDVNSLTSYYGKFDKNLWSAVAEKSPVMRFVKYLAKFLRKGVLTGEMLQRKVSVASLQKAKVFPFRLYTAYLALCRELRTMSTTFGRKFEVLPFADKLSSGEMRVQKTAVFDGETLDAQSVLNYLAEVMDDYARSYDWSLFADKKWVIAPDVSGSMTSPIGDSSVLTYASVSAMFAGFFIKGIRNVRVLPWDTSVHPYGVPAADSVMTHIRAITRMVGGGTYMETGVRYLLDHAIQTDYAVFLTDTEEYGSGWLSSWKEYHRRYPEAVAFVLRDDSYMTSPIDEKTAKELNVYQIFGWNDSVIDYMKFVIGERAKAA